MKIAVLTFDAFNELDSFVVASLLNRLAPQGFRAYITAATDRVVSMNGIVVEAQKPLEFTEEADAIVFGSGRKTDEMAKDPALLARITADPGRQLLVSQCSGALILAAKGLLADRPVCADLSTAPLLRRQGLNVTGSAFHAEGNVATAGGCLASQYIATWIIGRQLGIEAASAVIRYVAPVGQQDEYVDRAVATVGPFLAPRAGTKAVA
jgi:transcriptional regulator GlxA family with amidase domain